MSYILTTWKRISLDGHNVSEYFRNRGYKTIAIYGRGKLGGYLERELLHAGMRVAFFIDKNAANIIDCECKAIDDDFKVVDVIVITITEDLIETRKILEKKNKGKVKMLLDVLKDR